MIDLSSKSTFGVQIILSRLYSLPTSKLVFNLILNLPRTVLGGVVLSQKTHFWDLPIRDLVFGLFSKINEIQPLVPEISLYTTLDLC